MRTSRRLAVTVGLLGAVVTGAPTAIADTSGPTIPLDVWLSEASFTFTDEITTWNGIAQIEEERIGGTTRVSFQFNGQIGSVTCDAGTPGDPTDDYEASDSAEFTGERSRVRENVITEDLGSATIRMTVSGMRRQFDACSGLEISRRRERHTVGYVLAATEPPSGSTTIDCRADETGNRVQVTEVFRYAPAIGTVTMDRGDVTFVSGSMQNLRVTVGAPC